MFFSVQLLRRQRRFFLEMGRELSAMDCPSAIRHDLKPGRSRPQDLELGEKKLHLATMGDGRSSFASRCRRLVPSMKLCRSTHSVIGHSHHGGHCPLQQLHPIVSAMFEIVNPKVTFRIYAGATASRAEKEL